MRRTLLTALIAVLAAGAPVSLAQARDTLGGFEAQSLKNDKDKKDKGGDVGPQEAPPPPAFTACAMSDIGLSASAGSCFGWTEGNFNSGNGGDKTFSATVINNLLGVSSYSGTTLNWLENFNVSGGSVNFNTLLTGLTIVAFHVGGAGGNSTGVGYQSTAWYAFDAGTTGIDVLSFNRGGLSNARLYSTGTCLTCQAVPEPDAWALMILGFGGVGAALRSRRWKLAHA